jgi:iron complex outermembrane receptor protein
MLRRKSSLGETLDGSPGVSSTYFGPNVSRPVIRGLDGDRIRILQNSTGMLDASSLSFDHAVPYDPLVAERIEVVRGPAAVLYGGSAVGGVVNVIDNRIPQAPITGFTGRVEPRYGGPDRERSLGAVLEGGNGTFALHGDFFDRRTRDLRIPGFARSARQRATDGAGVAQPEGTLPNSNADADGGTLGGSLTWGSGYAGLSHGSFTSNYGSVAEPAVRVDMKSDRTDLAGEVRDLGPWVKSLKFKLGRTDYQHREIEDGAVNTTFLNEGNDGRLELAHAALGPVQGAVGMTFTKFDFSALGAEAFVPKTRTDAKGLFIYEELPLGNWKLSVGARNERTRIDSEGGGPVDASTGAPRFDPPQSRSFTANSTALGLLYNFTKELALAGNASFTQRAPTHYELFANGPHVATGAFEVGNPAFEKEKSRSLDLGVRWRRAAHSASVSVFRTRFANFISPFATGNMRGADGELNPADADEDNVADGSGEEILPEFTYQAVPAAFRGFEAQGRFRVYERNGALDLLLRGDYVKAWNRSTGQPLPRIAPLRLGLGLEYTLNRFSAGVDLQHARAQNRVAANELATDSYTLVNATLTYNVKQEPVAVQLFARANNIFDKEARNHVSFLKDQAPLPGRGLLLGVRASF